MEEEKKSVEETTEEVKQEVVEKQEEKKSTVQERKSNIWKYILAIVIIIIIILLLIKFCGNGKKYKIKIHAGDDIVEVDKNFKLSDLEVDGGKVSFLVDSTGHIVDPSAKLDPKKEYSAHIIPDGKEKVKVTYKNGDWSLTVEYQKGAGLLFPADPTKDGYVFVGWKNEDKGTYPGFMDPVNEDMTLVAQFEKTVSEGGKCTLNCDTNSDGVCDLNCDTYGDGKADTNIDKDGDGICDLNCDPNHDGVCDYKCDTNSDGKCDKNCGKNDGDGLETLYENDGDFSFDCDDEYPGLFTLIDDEFFISATIDGKELKPCPECYPYYTGDSKLVFILTEYAVPGKKYDMVFNFKITDETGQKYYLVITATATFEDNCDVNKKGETKEVTYKCEDYENDHGFLFTSPVKKDQVKYAIVDGKEITTDKDKDGYPVYDLADYFEDGKTISVEIGYNSPDADGNTSYNAKVLFPVCEFGVVEYTLTLNPNGGKVNPTSMRFIRGQIIYDLPYPTRKDYQFVGWYTEKKGGKLVSNETNTEMPEKDMTLYAHWESNKTPSETYTCPDGYKLSGTKCTKSTTDTKDARTNGYTCPSGFTYTDTDGKCHKEEEQGCPAGYDNGPNGCEKQVFKDKECGNPYHVCSDQCCEEDGTVTQRTTPHCPNGYYLTNDGTKCQTWLYDVQRGCYGEGSTEIPGSFLCDVVRNATPKYTCEDGYTLSGNKCTKTTTETIDATKKTN